MEDPASGIEKVRRLLREVDLSSEIPFPGKEAAHHRCKMMDVYHEPAVTGSHELPQNMLKHRPPSDLDKGLGPGLGKLSQTGSEPRRENHCSLCHKISFHTFGITAKLIKIRIFVKFKH